MIYILNVTDKTPRKICTLYNNCPSLSSLPPQHVARRDQVGVTADRVAIDERRAKKAAEWKATDYAGALRLVHVSDIHTDYLYAEVYRCCRRRYQSVKLLSVAPADVKINTDGDHATVRVNLFMIVVRVERTDKQPHARTSTLSENKTLEMIT